MSVSGCLKEKQANISRRDSFILKKTDKSFIETEKHSDDHLKLTSHLTSFLYLNVEKSFRRSKTEHISEYIAIEKLRQKHFRGSRKEQKKPGVCNQIAYKNIHKKSNYSYFVHRKLYIEKTTNTDLRIDKKETLKMHIYFLLLALSNKDNTNAYILVVNSFPAFHFFPLDVETKKSIFKLNFFLFISLQFWQQHTSTAVIGNWPRSLQTAPASRHHKASQSVT